MDVAQARAVLGVAEGDEWAAVRTAFRRLVRANHPDVAGPERSQHVTRILEAYATLQAERRSPTPTGRAGPGRARPAPPPPARPPAHRPGRPPIAAEAEGDTVTVDAPRREVFFRVLDAAHHLGEVTYVDPQIGLLETIVEFEGWPTCSLLVTLQGRATGVTEAWCTLESLTGAPPPPVSAVALLLRERLREA